MSDDTLMEFPNDFTFKVIGEATPEFEGEVLRIFRQYFPKLGEGAIQIKSSNNEKYLSYSIHVTAESKEQLDTVYQALSDNPLILFVL